jgi:hypothetical protein
MDYLYSVTATYDSAPKPIWIGRYSDALSAVETFQQFVDSGDAKEYATINLSEPSGKMHTKTLYNTGLVVTR